MRGAVVKPATQERVGLPGKAPTVSCLVEQESVAGPGREPESQYGRRGFGVHQADSPVSPDGDRPASNEAVRPFCCVRRVRGSGCSCRKRPSHGPTVVVASHERCTERLTRVESRRQSAEPGGILRRVELVVRPRVFPHQEVDPQSGRMARQEDAHEVDRWGLSLQPVACLSVKPVCGAGPALAARAGRRVLRLADVLLRGEVRACRRAVTEQTVPGKATLLPPYRPQLPPLPPLEPGPKAAVHLFLSAEVDARD